MKEITVMASENNPAGRITIADRIADFAEGLSGSLKSIVKLTLSSRPLPAPGKATGDSIIIMGNGPSLRQVLDNDLPLLQRSQTMAVNFAALSPEFFQIKPAYYIIVDPHFFLGTDDARIGKLKEALRRVDWPMTLILPRNRSFACGNQLIREMHINIVGVEGFSTLVNGAIKHRLGMPRPRNVLIPAILSAIWMGFSKIVIVGADHSWLQTLSVLEDNTVVTVQPHFYKDEATEQQRVNAIFKGVKLHSMLQNFAIAFKAYHTIAEYAAKHGVSVINATPGSYIDAFPRQPLSQAIR